MTKKKKQPSSELIKVTLTDEVPKNKPILRLLHHFACSGGTLISKCISALPNSFLLSELHPKSTLHMGSGKPKYLPSDITTQARYANIPKIQKLADKVFINSIKLTNEHVSNYGGDLVIRDHSHVDFCVGDSFEKESYVVNLLKCSYSIIRVATIRNPIDSYMSLIKNNWVHFTPHNFDEYCKRLWFFLLDFEESQIFKYEDFVKSPQKVLQEIATALDLDFDTSAIDVFSVFNVTGDSGRSGEIIESRERRVLDSAFIDEVQNSAYFQKIKDKFGYEI